MIIDDYKYAIKNLLKSCVESLGSFLSIEQIFSESELDEKFRFLITNAENALKDATVDELEELDIDLAVITSWCETDNSQKYENAVEQLREIIDERRIRCLIDEYVRKD